MGRSWWTVRARVLTPETIAYHEAGHVVVAYEFGWWVRRGGVRIGAWAHARLRHRDPDNTVLARVCISMAGLLAEQKFLGQQWRFEEDVVKHLRAVRAGEGEGLCMYPSDLRAIALALLDDDPPISLAGARRVVIYCQEYTEALLDDSRVWGGVERLAKVLYRRRYLSPRAVKKVLGDAFFIGVQRGEGARLGRVAPSDQGSGQVPGKPLQYLGLKAAPTSSGGTCGLPNLNAQVDQQARPPRPNINCTLASR